MRFILGLGTELWSGFGEPIGGPSVIKIQKLWFLWLFAAKRHFEVILETPSFYRIYLIIIDHECSLSLLSFYIMLQ